MCAYHVRTGNSNCMLFEERKKDSDNVETDVPRVSFSGGVTCSKFFCVES